MRLLSYFFPPLFAFRFKVVDLLTMASQHQNAVLDSEQERPMLEGALTFLVILTSLRIHLGKWSFAGSSQSTSLYVTVQALSKFTTRISIWPFYHKKVASAKCSDYITPNGQCFIYIKDLHYIIYIREFAVPEVYYIRQCLTDSVAGLNDLLWWNQYCNSNKCLLQLASVWVGIALSIKSCCASEVLRQQYKYSWSFLTSCVYLIYI